MRDVEQSSTVFLLGGCLMNFYKKLGEIRPNQLITTYGPGSIMDAVNDSLTVLDIEYWDTNNIGKEIRDARLASYMNVRRFFMPKTGGKEDIPVVSFPYYHVCSKGTCKFLFDMRDYFDMDQYKKNQGEVKCPKCGFPAYPSRFITVCEDGIWTISLGDGGTSWRNKL